MADREAQQRLAEYHADRERQRAWLDAFGCFVAMIGIGTVLYFGLTM